MLKKLRLKFIAVNMGIVIAMLLVIFGLIYHFTKSDMEQQSFNALQDLTQSVQQYGSYLPGKTDVQLPHFVIQVNLWGEMTISGSTYMDLSDEKLLRELIEYVYTADTSTGYMEKYNLLFSKVPAMGVQRLIFVDISIQKATLTSMVETSILVGLVSLLAFLGISFLLARWAVKPVDRAWKQQKQFVSDASHELKTPLTVIMSNAELLQSPNCDEENRQKFAGSILTMSHQMRKLVEGLLELARADNAQVKKSFSAVDYSKLVADALLPFEPIFYEKGLTLQSNLQQGIVLTGSEQYLHQLVDILLDNAGKYSAPGIVAVDLQRQGRGQCLLTVANPGEPIATEDLKRIFERFYRTDKARSRTGSFGLGLAIAQSVVQEHGGRIWAESNVTGNRFCVLLPCNP